MRSTFLPVMCESVLESHLREAESSSTSFTQEGLMKAARKNGLNAECGLSLDAVLVEKGWESLQEQQLSLEEVEVCVDGS